MNVLHKSINKLQLKNKGKICKFKKNFCSHLEYLEKTPITVKLWERRKEHHLKASKTASSSENSVKKPSDSRVDVLYDFQGDKGLKETYIDGFGNVLMGRLLEDLDALAGNVAFFHCDDGNPESPGVSLVTAAVERMKFESSGISINKNLVLTGQVVYKGSSSLDVLIEAHSTDCKDQENPEKVEMLDPLNDSTRLLQSVFTYVARDKATGKAAKIINLDIDGCSKHEINFHKVREDEANYRRKVRKGEAVTDYLKSLDQQLRWLMLERGKSMQDMPALHTHNQVVLQQTTALENSFICEPQKSNTGGRVFGGFLINRAYMLAQANAYLFSGKPATLTMVDKITFRRPVEISDLIRLRSRITYCSKENPFRMVVMVTCDIARPESGVSYQSNKFTFVFTSNDEVGDESIKTVLPLNRMEAESAFHGACNVLGIDPETIKEEYKN